MLTCVCCIIFTLNLLVKDILKCDRLRKCRTEVDAIINKYGEFAGGVGHSFGWITGLECIV